MGVRLVTSWRVVGASAPGTSHLERGLPCQDAHHSVVTDAGLVAAVADGAGSAPNSDLGATVAVRFSTELLAWHLAEQPPSSPRAWRGLLLDVFIATRRAVARAARDAGVRVGDLASTLLLLAATDDTVAVAQVGDGAVVVRHGEDSVATMAAGVDEGEYLNETTFLTSRDWRRDWCAEVRAADDVGAVALLTDGLQLVALDLASGKPHAPFFDPMFAFASGEGASPDELDGFLRSARLCERTDDDKTLLVAVRR